MSFQVDDFFQPWPEPSKVAVGTRGDPLGLGQRGCARQFFDQCARQADTAVVASANLADVHGGRCCWLGNKVGTLDPCSNGNTNPNGVHCINGNWNGQLCSNGNNQVTTIVCETGSIPNF